MRDDRRRIMELAEEKSLVSDEVAVRGATAVLTNPRRRLEAEIGWLPGLAPKRISEAISVLEREPAKVRGLGNLPSLARANLLADGLIRVVLDMRSKVHPKYKAKYRVGNWSAYEQALVQRGDVTLWLSADATDAWRPSPSGRPGAPKTFSDCAIETALTLRLVFRLPLRQAEGFLRSVLSLMGVDLAAPDHTTLSRRSQSLAVEFRRIPSRGPIHRIVDSTGRSIVGEGEWAAVNHGGRGHRGWKTLHLAVDRVGVIVAHALTEPTVDDATIGIDLIETVDDEIARVTADAAYETVAFYAAAEMRDATVVVPPSKTARVSRRRPRSRARDRTITDVRTLGRRRWKQEAGYQLQARVENAFFRYKSILGDRLRARSRGGRVAESVVACHVLNQMTELGRPESYNIGR